MRKPKARPRQQRKTKERSRRRKDYRHKSHSHRDACDRCEDDENAQRTANDDGGHGNDGGDGARISVGPCKCMPVHVHTRINLGEAGDAVAARADSKSRRSCRPHVRTRQLPNRTPSTRQEAPKRRAVCARAPHSDVIVRVGAVLNRGTYTNAHTHQQPQTRAQDEQRNGGRRVGLSLSRHASQR